ncbi:MAG: malectin domain-containing carbohydrate-binding protein [Bryobacteraceae bacterium]
MASTSSPGVGLGGPSDDQCRAELTAVLSSEAFRRSPKLSRLLQYLCEKRLDGQAGEITEYGIALDVLGRDAQFDPQHDAVVRVDAHHLRKRLKEYYAGDGADRQIRIVISNGQYAPQFAGRDAAAAPEDLNGSATPELGPTAAEPRPLSGKWALGKWKWLAALVLAALAVSWAGLHYRQTVARATEDRAAPGATGGTPAPAGMESGEIRIAAGDRTAPYIDTAGRAWLADRYFSGGTTFHRPDKEIQRTPDPDLFQNGREGQFVYAIPLRPGIYELHLYFAETGVTTDTLRDVSIAINGQPALGVDVASDAGGVNTATMKVFKDISPAKDGYLRLMFQGAEPRSSLNAIEILPGIPGKIHPIRITAGDRVFRDHLGQIWLPDQWAAGGRISTRVASVNGTPDPGLYQWRRVGHFSYSIPVAEGGVYTVILHFSENWFTPPNSLGGVGSRVFDVYCNGNTLLQDFDILKEAGGVGNRAVVRTFNHIPASPLGKIDLTFAPVANYSLINAIEVLEE